MNYNDLEGKWVYCYSEIEDTSYNVRVEFKKGEYYYIKEYDPIDQTLWIPFDGPGPKGQWFTLEGSYRKTWEKFKDHFYTESQLRKMKIKKVNEAW